MPNAEQVKAAIAPGSTPYGERGELEQAIGTSSAVSAPMPVQGRISSQDPFTGGPMAALLGQGGYTSDRPVTSGLSVGPGAGPAVDLSGLPLDVMKKLHVVATTAKSPQLRGAALLALRRIVRNRSK